MITFNLTKTHINLNRILTCVFLISLFCFANIPLFAISNIESFKPKYGITNANVNFRQTPSTSSSIVKQISKGTAVKIVGSIDNFYIVQLGTNEVGYLYKDYVDISDNYSSPTGALTYTNLGNITATINSSDVNFRTGPSTNFSSITKLQSGTNITVIGEISGWYLAITSNNTIGMIYKLYVNLGENNQSADNTNTDNNTNENVVDDITLILNLINDARVKAGVDKLKLGATLPRLAQLKAEDMVKNSYFSHTSKTYGTPFEMMANYNVDYIAAGENIAGNPDITKAVEAWLTSDTHKQNLLSSSYNYVGIGVAPSDVYGNIIVVMFVGI